MGNNDLFICFQLPTLASTSTCTVGCSTSTMLLYLSTVPFVSGLKSRGPSMIPSTPIGARNDAHQTCEPHKENTLMTPMRNPPTANPPNNEDNANENDDTHIGTIIVYHLLSYYCLYKSKNEKAMATTHIYRTFHRRE